MVYRRTISTGMMDDDMPMTMTMTFTTALGFNLLFDAWVIDVRAPP